MKRLALSTIEASINHYLQLDKDALLRLNQLHPKIILVEITDWNIRLYCQPAAHGINLFTHWNQTPDTTIRAKLSSLLRVTLNNSNTKSLFDNEITIQGDMQLAEELKQVMRTIDIDWESHIAKIVGDTAAVGLVEAGKNICHFLKTKNSALHDQLSAFIQNEQSIIIDKKLLRQFSDQVTTLRHDTERLDSLLNRLHQDNKQ